MVVSASCRHAPNLCCNQVVLIVAPLRFRAMIHVHLPPKFLTKFCPIMFISSEELLTLENRTAEVVPRSMLAIMCRVNCAVHIVFFSPRKVLF